MVMQQRAARTRKSLISAAAEVFARDGFVTASLATISKRAGVSNGALHFHFENKNALAQAVEDEAAAVVRLIIGQVAQAERGALQSLVDATHELMRRLADDVVFRAGFDLSGDAARGGGSELRLAWQRWIEDALRQAEHKGHLAEGVSVEGAATAIMAATVGFEVLGGKDKEWLSERKITRFWDLMLPRLAEARQLESVSSRPSVDGKLPPLLSQETD
ncbi:ScbR family autoregulator-binding transcription factor [Streptomyces flavidovirens]|uniref:ScbR family autoregulator-binding transcription factor n=1 Tax=Streptomyces flavidovirens TaxID=67298 RepID=UPI003419FE3A